MRSPQAFKQFIAAFSREDDRLKRAAARGHMKGGSEGLKGGSGPAPKLRLYAFHVDFARYLVVGRCTLNQVDP
jgi:hypothetical protein